MPLLLAGAACSLVDFAGVRALLLLPELPVAGGLPGAVLGAAPESVVVEELDEDLVLAVDRLVRALAVLPELAPAPGSFAEVPPAELEVFVESLDALLDFRLLAFADLPSPVLPSAAEESPVGGVALAEGSAAALFLVLLVAVGVVPAVSPTLLLLDFFREEVVEAPDALEEFSVVAVSFVAASLEAAFFLDLVFLAEVDVSPEAACELVESVESAAAFFFFFFVVVESLCDWSVD